MSRKFEVSLGDYKTVLALDAEIESIVEVNVSVIIQQKKYKKTITYPTSGHVGTEKVDSLSLILTMNALLDIKDNKAMTFKEIVDDI